MGLALDEPKENDEKLELQGVTVVADRQLLRQTGDISIAFNPGLLGGGISIQSANPLGSADGCGSCSC